MAQTYVDALVSGIDDWRWNTGSALGSPATVSYSFMTQIPAQYYDEGVTDVTSFQAFDADQQAAARDVLAQYAKIANLTFTDLGNGQSGQILFGMNAQAGSAGYAYLPSSFFAIGGDVWISDTEPSLSSNLMLEPGEAGYFVLMHELGHALGLKHPFETIDGGSEVTLSADNTTQYTVMSYTFQPERLYMEVVNPGTASEDLIYTSIRPSTPMLYDIAALQYLYGANTATRAGNDSYSFDPDEPFFMCIWDGGGKDSISVASFTLGCEIDLRAGEFSNIMIPSDAIPPSWSATAPTYDGTDNLSIAFGVTIENATGGAGADTLTGNSAANVLKGGGGADKLSGGGGADSLYGGPGKDALTGGGGADKFVFDSAPSNLAADSIKDFVHASDKIQLDNAVFGQLGADGALAAGAFYASPKAHDATDRILYDKVSGNVYYDADGSGAQAKVLLAVLAGSPDAVSVADFRVI